MILIFDIFFKIIPRSLTLTLTLRPPLGLLGNPCRKSEQSRTPIHIVLDFIGNSILLGTEGARVFGGENFRNQTKNSRPSPIAPPKNTVVGELSRGVMKECRTDRSTTAAVELFRRICAARFTKSSLTAGPTRRTLRRGCWSVRRPPQRRRGNFSGCSL